MALFEAGSAYTGDQPEDQAMVIGAVRRGLGGPRHWLEPPCALHANIHQPIFLPA